MQVGGSFEPQQEPRDRGPGSGGDHHSVPWALQVGVFDEVLAPHDAQRSTAALRYDVGIAETVAQPCLKKRRVFFLVFGPGNRKELHAPIDAVLQGRRGMGQFGFGRADHTDGAQSNGCSQGRCGVQVVGPRAAEREQGGLRLQQCALHMVHQLPGLVARRR